MSLSRLELTGGDLERYNKMQDRYKAHGTPKPKARITQKSFQDEVFQQIVITPGKDKRELMKLMDSTLGKVRIALLALEKSKEIRAELARGRGQAKKKIYFPA
jgi:predicted transcriptional regulator